MTGVWMQDWVGTKEYPEGTRLNWNWKLNNKTYPTWDNMVRDWMTDGVRPLVYINPYLANLTTNASKQATAAGPKTSTTPAPKPKPAASTGAHFKSGFVVPSFSFSNLDE